MASPGSAMGLELREGHPASSRTLGTPHPRHQAMIDNGNLAIAEPVTGICTPDGAVAGLFPLAETGLSFATTERARAALLASVTKDQRDAAQFPLDTDNWRRWSNIHRFLMRHGLLLDDLDDAGRALALDVVSSVLSPAGVGAVRGVMRINETIQEISGRLDEDGIPEFGEWMYWLSLMGDASVTEPWGWQFDGHHLNMNCLMIGDQIVVTPFFLGSEPLVADSGKFAGTRVLEREERAALDLMDSLDDRQRALAVTSETMPPGLFTGAFHDNVVLDYEGIAGGELGEGQRRLLVALIESYVGRLAHEICAVKMAEVMEHIDRTYFSWMGRTGADDVFYYRVHSPVILLEFDHEPGIVFVGDEPMKSHVHTMMRTPNGNDYGIDYIRQHRLSHPHHASLRSAATS